MIGSENSQTINDLWTEREKATVPDTRRLSDFQTSHYLSKVIFLI